jgi:pyruvate kinase
MKKTKILCTIGPASMRRETLRRMHASGMDAVRINTAFGNIKEYKKIAKLVHSIADIPILVDLKGPEIRLKCQKEVRRERGDVISVGPGSRDGIVFNRDIYRQLKPKDVLLLNKGKTKAKVIERRGRTVRLTLEGDCILKDGSGVNVPGRRLDLPTLSAQDKNVIGMSKALGLDYIALSFTRDASDIRHLKARLKGSQIGVIAKIENQEGVDNAHDILKSCDGVMIARGDLGIEIPPERIPLIQKELITKCNRMGKISIVATEMLHTMVENPQPTRAETSDVANAILDGADVVMLSGESAIGKYPAEAVRTMTRIAVEVESHLPLKPLDEEIHEKVPLAISKAVTSIIETINIDKIVVATHTGYTAMLISNFRICKDIIAITDDPKIRRKLHLVYAVQPIYHRSFREKDRILDIARYCHKDGLVGKNDIVLFTAGVYTDKPTTNIVQIHRMSELLEYNR